MRTNASKPSGEAIENDSPPHIDGAPSQHPANTLLVKECASPLVAASNTWKPNTQNTTRKRKEAPNSDQPFRQANKTAKHMPNPQQQLPSTSRYQPAVQPFAIIHPNASAKSLITAAQPMDFASIAIQMHVNSIANAKLAALKANQKTPDASMPSIPKAKPGRKRKEKTSPSSAPTKKSTGGKVGRPPKGGKRPRGRPPSANKDQSAKGKISKPGNRTATPTLGGRGSSADGQVGRPRSSSSAKRAKHDQRPSTPNPLKKNPSSRSLTAAAGGSIRNNNPMHDSDNTSNDSRSSTPPPMYTKQDLPTFSEEPLHATIEYLCYLAKNVGNLPKFPPQAQHHFNTQQRIYREQITRILFARDGRRLEKPRQEGTRRSARARSAPDAFHPAMMGGGLARHTTGEDGSDDIGGVRAPEGSSSDVRLGPEYQCVVPVQQKKPDAPTDEERKYCGELICAAGSVRDGSKSRRNSGNNKSGRNTSSGRSSSTAVAVHVNDGVRDLTKEERFKALQAESSRLIHILGRDTATAFGIGSMGIVMADSLTQEQQQGMYHAMKEYGRNFYKACKYIMQATVVDSALDKTVGGNGDNSGDDNTNSGDDNTNTKNGGLDDNTNKEAKIAQPSSTTTTTQEQQQQQQQQQQPPLRPRILSSYYYDVWKIQGCPAAVQWYADKAAEAAAIEEEERELERQRELEAARRAERHEASWRRRQVKEAVLYVKAAAKIPGTINYHKPIVRERVMRIRRILCKEIVAVVQSSGGGGDTTTKNDTNSHDGHGSNDGGGSGDVEMVDMKEEVVA